MHIHLQLLPIMSVIDVFRKHYLKKEKLLHVSNFSLLQNIFSPLTTFDMFPTQSFKLEKYKHCIQVNVKVRHISFLFQFSLYIHWSMLNFKFLFMFAYIVNLFSIALRSYGYQSSSCYIVKNSFHIISQIVFFIEHL